MTLDAAGELLGFGFVRVQQARRQPLDVLAGLDAPAENLRFFLRTSARQVQLTGRLGELEIAVLGLGDQAQQATGGQSIVDVARRDLRCGRDQGA